MKGFERYQLLGSDKGDLIRIILVITKEFLTLKKGFLKNSRVRANDMYVQSKNISVCTILFNTFDKKIFGLVLFYLYHF